MPSWKTCLVCAVLALGACDAPSTQTTAPAASSGTATVAEAPATTPAAPTPVQPPPVAKPTTVPSASAHAGRALHPLNPTMSGCVEMYSACSGTPPRCTSAPLSIDCNQSAQLPTTKEWLHCVCP